MEAGDDVTLFNQNHPVVQKRLVANQKHFWAQQVFTTKCWSSAVPRRGWCWAWLNRHSVNHNKIWYKLTFGVNNKYEQTAKRFMVTNKTITLI